MAHHSEKWQAALSTMSTLVAQVDMTKLIKAKTLDLKAVVALTELECTAKFAAQHMEVESLKQVTTKQLDWPAECSPLLDGITSDSSLVALKELVGELQTSTAGYEEKLAVTVSKALGNITVGQALARPLLAGESRSQICSKCLFLLKRTSIMTVDEPVLNLLKEKALS